jgi:carboxypeptidase D
MMEIGPWRADEEGGLKIARGGWNEYTTMVYGKSVKSLALFKFDLAHFSPFSVDQPAGTGFSYTSTNNYVHSIQQVCVETYGHNAGRLSGYAISGD